MPRHFTGIFEASESNRLRVRKGSFIDLTIGCFVILTSYLIQEYLKKAKPLGEFPGLAFLKIDNIVDDQMYGEQNTLNTIYSESFFLTNDKRV